MKLILVICLLFLAGCESLRGIGAKLFSSKLKAPIAMKREKQVIAAGVNSRSDYYDWMSNRSGAEVRKHLKAERNYTKKVLENTQEDRDRIYQEILTRADVSSESLKKSEGLFEYFYRYSKGSEYPVFYLRNKNKEESEKIILDSRIMAKGKSYFKISNAKLSPNGKYLAYTVDTAGRRLYELRFRDIAKRRDIRVRIKGITSNFVWSNDSRYVFYVKQDKKTLRWNQVWRLDLKSPKVDLVFEEDDNEFYVSLRKSLNKKSIFIRSKSSTNSETVYLSANNPRGRLQKIQARYDDVLYKVFDGGDRFYILTNYRAKNFKVIKTPKSSSRKGFSYWRDIVKADENKYIEDIVVHKDFIGIQYKLNGLNRIKVLTRDLKLKSHELSFDDPIYYASLTSPYTYYDSSLRYQYMTLNKPREDIAYQVYKQEPTVIREQSVPLYNSQNYITETIDVKARDGKLIPVTMTSHKGTRKTQQTPIVLSGYGAYGYTYEPRFSKALPSLLDRGFIFAIAHVRGSSKKGRQWYLDGKMLNKKNSFNDFVDVGNYFVAQGMTSSRHLYAWGGSAGGLLVGASVNQAPSLFHGVVAEVPFVDVLNTMLDSSLPLTTNEYKEWGNPNKQEFYQYIQSYSPYDNIVKQRYPHILATSYWSDSQVQYFEPAKWVAKLREYNTNSQSQILLDIHFTGSHSGASGRLGKYKSKAQLYAYLMMLESSK